MNIISEEADLGQPFLVSLQKVCVYLKVVNRVEELGLER